MIAFEAAAASIGAMELGQIGGEVAELRDTSYRARGLGAAARIGDGVELVMQSGETVDGEIVGLDGAAVTVMAYDSIRGAAIGDRVWLRPSIDPAPSLHWLGRVMDAFGRPILGGFAPSGERRAPLNAAPPQSLRRRPVGERLATGHAAFDAMLPICRGQRIGIFAGSGVGKSRLKAALAQHMSADVVVIGLIGERGREVRDFVEKTLGDEAMARAVVIAATSDQPAAVKRRAAWLTLSVAEYFRDEGAHVLMLLDSLTRFAEAHREVALTSGESGTLSGFPPSTAPMVARLAERAGPGEIDGPGGRWGAAPGDITGIFTVLVAGSDMDEPVADMIRGMLDGHTVLSRDIAERGRFPAVDVRRSVSRSLPEAASPTENGLIAKARRVLATYEQAAPMIQIGLYKRGTDPEIDEAVRLWPALDAFFAERSESPDAAFQRLAAILGDGGSDGGAPVSAG